MKNTRENGRRRVSDGKSKAKRAKGLHEQAEELRKQARAECDRRNARAEKSALEKFGKGAVAGMFRDEARFAIGMLAFQTREILSGECPDPSSVQCDAVLVRLLSAHTTTEYRGWRQDAMLSDDEVVRRHRAHALRLSRGVIVVQTEASRIQALVRKALADYALAAAVHAKRKKSASMLKWAEIIDVLGRVHPDFAYAFSEERAGHIVALKSSASDILRFEEIVGRLPRRMPAKKAVR